MNELLQNQAVVAFMTAPSVSGNPPDAYTRLRIGLLSNNPERLKRLRRRLCQSRGTRFAVEATDQTGVWRHADLLLVEVPGGLASLAAAGGSDRLPRHCPVLGLTHRLDEEVEALGARLGLGGVLEWGEVTPAVLMRWWRTLQREHKTRQALQEARRRHRQLLDASGAIPYELDPQDGRLRYVGTRAHGLLGVPVPRWLERGFLESAVFPADRQRLGAARRQAIASGSAQSEYRVRHADGGVVWLRDMLERDADGLIRGYLLDMTGQRSAEERLDYLRRFDILTELPNRTCFLENVESDIRAGMDGQSGGLVCLSLDRFRELNELLGHDGADMFLRVFAERLRRLFGPRAVPGRTSGNEFAVWLREPRDEADWQRLMEEALRAIAEPVPVHGQEIFSTVSAGIARFPGHGTDAAALLRNAESALLRARQGGAGEYRFFAEDPANRNVGSLRYEAALYRATERGEFVVHYQPLVQTKDGRIVGLEALLRWDRPDIGLVGPAEFTPALEETGLIIPVGLDTLDTVVRQIVEWRDAGLELVPVAVNLSARQLEHPGFAKHLAELLAANDVPANLLELEITESTFMQNSQVAREAIAHLCGIGVGLAIDDFGTGYSSLGYLKRLPVRTLKIDRSFLFGLPEDRDNVAIVTAVHSIARHLGLRLVAEGVETLAQLSFLRQLECGIAQGFLFGGATPASRVAGLLADGSVPLSPPH
ncbi:MAG: EAL domain-containing protein [Gammaproteobacteria bacterium]